MNKKSTLTRCGWADGHELFSQYHDHEWGVLIHDDTRLFEMLTLEGAQAGLSWLTVLKKRENYRKAFASFDPKKVACFTAAKQKALLENEGIIRNRLKISSTVDNAKAFLLIQKEYGSFDIYIWKFVDGKPFSHKKRKEALEISECMSKDLKKRGFRFVGGTICFAFMQATGMVHDHEPHCFRAPRPRKK